jgi:3-methyladenine DNA glycosylase AlkD
LKNLPALAAMTLAETLKELEALGTAQNRKIYRRHGASENLFGVSFANLNALKKRIKTDHALALGLWKTGNDDARTLAIMIADPARMTDRVLDAWARGLNGFTASTFPAFVARTTLARNKMEDWIDSPREWTSCAGWALLAQLAMNDPALPDSFFTAHLSVIGKEIHGRPNWVRDAMNSALIAIGVRNPALTEAALRVAKTIGKVEVDHGQTSCETKDAAAYIHKTLEHRRRKK